ncbi:15041_t:CDS:1 [Entrophospora sp. SA101]|nr:15041_t:CDS:1 [Entrophospora sp. SA101]
MKELYIGNINFRATESQVEHVLNEFSNSRLKSFSLIRDRGFGFALFENDEDADVLLEASENGIECMGRILSISPSRGKRKSVRNVEDGLMSSLEPSFEIESLELGRWGGGRRQKTRNRNKKSKRNTDFTWTFLSAWSYNDQGKTLLNKDTAILVKFNQVVKVLVETTTTDVNFTGALVHFGFVTHSTHMSQRYVATKIKKTSLISNAAKKVFALDVEMPPNGNMMPPGRHHYLYINNKGVPAATAIEINLQK